MGARLYFKANKALSAKIAAIWKDAEAKMAAGRKLAKRIGATDCFISRGVFSQEVSGFSFKEPPDPKLFCRLKNSDGWRPRRTRANASLIAEMVNLKSSVGSDVAKLIGMKTLHAGGGGIAFYSPGVTVVGGVTYISVPDHVTNPKDCIRISDLEYERKTGKGKKKKATA